MWEAEKAATHTASVVSSGDRLRSDAADLDVNDGLHDEHLVIGHHLVVAKPSVDDTYPDSVIANKIVDLIISPC